MSEEAATVVVNGETTTTEVVTNGDHSEEITTSLEGVTIQTKSVESVKSTTISSSETSETVVVKSSQSETVTVTEGDKPAEEEEKKEEEAEKKDEEVKENGDAEETVEKTEAVETEAAPEGEEKKEEGEETKEGEEEKKEETEEDKKKANGKTPKTPKEKKIKESNPNSPVRKILRIFACGSDSAGDSKSIEGETSRVNVTDAKGEEPKKLDFGMCVVTTKPEEPKEPKEGEEAPEPAGPAHFAAELTRNGIADQFGIRDNDELMMLNYFPMAGKAHCKVVSLFEEEELPRKTHLLFRRKVPAGKKTAFDYHFVTGDIQQLENPGDEGKPAGDYHVNNLTHHIVRDTASATIVAPLERVHVQSTKDAETYMRFEDNKLSAATDFDATSDKFVFEMIMRIVIRPTLEPQVVFRHKMESSESTYMFLNQDDKDIKVQEETDLTGNLPKVVSPNETMHVRGISNKAQTYAFESIAERGNYVTVDGESVKVDSIPEGQVISEELAYHFHVFASTSS